MVKTQINTDLEVIECEEFDYKGSENVLSIGTKSGIKYNMLLHNLSDNRFYLCISEDVIKDKESLRKVIESSIDELKKRGVKDILSLIEALI